ncbi:MAG: zinc-ribbon domain-containing protein [Promethearchaeota archaeon]
MFCSKCGVRLSDSNQNFCPNCGTEIITHAKTTSYTEKPQIELVIKKQKGTPGNFSKLCLGMALASLILGVVPLYGGFFIYLGIGFYLSLVLNLVGLILGIFSKVYSSKAVIHEPYNSLEKAGSIIGIIAIIFNSIGLVFLLLGTLNVTI